MDYIKAFVTGGLLCAAVQILMDKTKLMPGRIMVLLVVCGSILGAIGLYEPYAKWAGSGATVLLIWEYALKGVRMELTRMGFWGCSPADSRRVRRGFPGR
ncbi:MAG: SpoVA/SpoVAEb family sporulation membrane protein [Clostridium fessum]